MKDYFNVFIPTQSYQDFQLGHYIQNDYDLILEDSIVIVGCPDLRGEDLDELTNLSSIREALYALSVFNFELPIIDLGDIKAGHQLEDTYYILKQISEHVLKQDAFLIVLGGSKDLITPMFEAFEYQKRPINLTEISPEIPIYKHKESYLKNMILNDKNMLFHYAQLGYQTHFIDKMSLKLIDSMDFEAIRLGELTLHINETEPVLRSTDLVLLDVNGIESDNNHSKTQPQVNGFNKREICKIARYAGLSRQLQAFGLFNFISDLRHGIDHQLLSQIIWYLIEGLNERKKIPETQDYLKYIVIQEDKEIIFYKDRIINRWWIVMDWKEEEFNWLIPCTEKDYISATKGDLPDRYWKTIKKFL